MKTKTLTEERIEKFYMDCKSLRKKEDYSEAIQEYSDRYQISKNYMLKEICLYCKKYNKPSIIHCISENQSRYIANYIKKNPDNITEAIRRYVRDEYLEIDENSKEFKSKVKYFATKWYKKISNEHVCFMIASGNSKPVVNRKNVRPAKEVKPRKSVILNIVKTISKFFNIKM